MSEKINHFPSYISHNVEIYEGYLCLFDSIDRTQVKFLPLRQKYLDEAKQACDEFDFDSLKRVAAFAEIVDSRVEYWCQVWTPELIIDAFKDNYSGHKEHYASVVTGSFEEFMEAYENFISGFFYDSVKTPFDTYPDEDDLRELQSELSAELVD